MKPENIIFTLDDAPYSSAYVFEGMFNLMQPVGALIPCVWGEGNKNGSYICTRADYERIVKPSYWLDERPYVLAVTSCNKMYAQLEYHDGAIKPLGSLHHVHELEALVTGDYIYRPDMKCFWVAKHGNPDGSYRESKARVETALKRLPVETAE